MGVHPRLVRVRPHGQPPWCAPADPPTLWNIGESAPANGCDLCSDGAAALMPRRLAMTSFRWEA